MLLLVVFITLVLILRLLSCSAINLLASMANMLTWFTIFPLKKFILDIKLGKNFGCLCSKFEVMTFDLRTDTVLSHYVIIQQQMLVQLWPYINDMVVKILKEQVEPEIQKNVPGFLSSIYFKEISLGEVVSQTEGFTHRKFAIIYM